MEATSKARKTRDTLKNLLEIGQELMINQVRLKDSRGDKKAKLNRRQPPFTAGSTAASATSGCLWRPPAPGSTS